MSGRAREASRAQPWHDLVGRDGEVVEGAPECRHAVERDNHSNIPRPKFRWLRERHLGRFGARGLRGLGYNQWVSGDWICWSGLQQSRSRQGFERSFATTRLLSHVSVTHGRALRVLSYTTLFPSPARPFHGLFIKNRIERLGRLCDLRVVAPVSLLHLRGTCVPSEATLDGIRILYPKFAVIPRLFKFLDGRLLYLQSRGAVHRLLAERPIDVLDAHYAYPDGHAARLLARDLGVPYVLSLRGSDAYVLSRFPARRRRIEQALAAAARIVTVSAALAEFAEGLGAQHERIRVIPNGVDTQRFRPLDRNEARAARRIPEGTTLLLSVGRLDAVKGFDLFLHGVARLAKRSPASVRCVILGEGPARARLAALVTSLGLEGRVDLPGWVAPEDLPTWYAAADLFVLLSESEGWPNVVVEALACGAPVIASKVGGIPEMISDRVNGFLLSERTPEATAECLARGIDRTWNRDAIQRSPVVRDWTDTAKLQLDVLREAANEP